MSDQPRTIELARSRSLPPGTYQIIAGPFPNRRKARAAITNDEEQALAKHDGEYFTVSTKPIALAPERQKKRRRSIIKDIPQGAILAIEESGLQPGDFLLLRVLNERGLRGVEVFHRRGEFALCSQISPIRPALVEAIYVGIPLEVNDECRET